MSACLEATWREALRSVADQALMIEATRAGHHVADHLEAAIKLETERLTHQADCNCPSDACRHLHDAMAIEVLITDRDSKPRKASLHRQRSQRIAALRRELVLELFSFP
eukprot:3256946-Amphidinium_carterae.1